MHGAQERKFAARAGPSIASSGLHTVNKLLTVLLQAPKCRATVGQRFDEDKVMRSSYSKTRIMPCYAMFNRTVLLMMCVFYTGMGYRLCQKYQIS